MDAQDKFVADNNMIKRWDKESGQFYGEVDKEGENYKIWLEDENSIKLKTSLVNKYDLAGVASWRKGYEKEEIWETISNNIRLN
jgi:spore germination protein YaaH